MPEKIKEFMHKLISMNKLEELMKKLEELMNKLEESISKLEELMNKPEESMNKLEELMNKLEELKNKLEESMNKLEELKNKLEESISKLEESISKLEKSMNKLEESMNKLEELMNKLEESISKLEELKNKPEEFVNLIFLFQIKMRARKKTTRSSLKTRSLYVTEKQNRQIRSETVSESGLDQRIYERDRKRKWRRMKQETEERDEPAKRGRKETVAIKSMSAEEKRSYDNMRQRISREKRKALNESTNQGQQVQAKENEEDIDFEMEEQRELPPTAYQEASAILNVIANSPAKKKSKRRLADCIKNYLRPRFSASEMLDVMIAVGHSLDEKSKERLVDLGLTLRPVPTRQKRGSFSGLPKASKHRHKEHIVTLLKDYTSEIISLSYKNIFISLCDVWGHQMDTLKLWGIELKTELIPAEMRVANVILQSKMWLI